MSGESHSDPEADVHVHLLTLRYDPTQGVLDDSPLATFTRDKVILSLRDHFFTVGEKQQH